MTLVHIKVNVLFSSSNSRPVEEETQAGSEVRL